jgi:ABC-type polysaccharide/polyol phosphate transport system ATPase subunit
MPALAIRVERIGKMYEVSVRRAAGRLYDRIASPFARKNAHAGDRTIWAVRDVSFELPQGQIMGVIGRNGSGKSTLMKMLARVTFPTEGRAEVRGRVGALLQVGAGFHPELSGRDNIALSGAILGMTRSEIKRQEDRIIAFSEIEEFMDMPVKYYSSGMYVRLAFAVSSHLDSEIMLIDEVLSVGDAVFQEKCRERIQTIVGEGRTVMLVTHSMKSVTDTCDTAMVLDHGQAVYMGPAQGGVDFYEQHIIGGHSVE